MTRILLPGFKTNVYDYLIASDYYISASDVEGIGKHAVGEYDSRITYVTF